MEFYGNAMEARGEPRMSTEFRRNFRGFPWQLYGYPWSSVDFYGALRLCLQNRGIPWCFKDLRGVPWFSMDTQDFPWTWSFSVVENGGSCHDNRRQFHGHPRKLHGNSTEISVEPHETPRNVVE